MVFTNLGSHEKQAFFDLLDEYFSSRPELLVSLGGNGAASSGADLGSAGSLANNPHAKAAASAVHNALASNPEATARLVSSGLQHGAKSGSVRGSPFASAAANPAIANSVGRVAAASLAFQNRNNNNNSPPTPPAARSTPPPPPAPRHVPPTLPRRTSSTSQEQEQEDEGTSPPPPSRPSIPKKAGGASELVSGRSFGDVDTTSFKAGFMSVKNSSANKAKGPPSVAPPVPPAFPKRHNFAPPPARRVTSDSGPPPPPTRARTPTPEPEPEEDGEWAEALYDYNSGEQGDVVLQERQRVKVVSRDSDDWWTGEANGKTGLFPASYVRVL